MLVIVISRAPLDTSHDAEWTTLAKSIHPIIHFAGGVTFFDKFWCRYCRTVLGKSDRLWCENVSMCNQYK